MVFADADVVRFSASNIRDLNGVTVVIFDTTRKKEFKELTCQQGTFDNNGTEQPILLVKSDNFEERVGESTGRRRRK